jgi:hypothetical protein
LHELAQLLGRSRPVEQVLRRVLEALGALIKFDGFLPASKARWPCRASSLADTLPAPASGDVGALSDAGASSAETLPGEPSARSTRTVDSPRTFIECGP